MNDKVYIQVFIGHQSLKSGKFAIVALPAKPGTLIREIAEQAKEKVCEKINLPKNEVTLIEYRFFGEELLFIDDCIRELVY